MWKALHRKRHRTQTTRNTTTYISNILIQMPASPSRTPFCKVHSAKKHSMLQDATLRFVYASGAGTFANKGKKRKSRHRKSEQRLKQSGATACGNPFWEKDIGHKTRETRQHQIQTDFEKSQARPAALHSANPFRTDKKNTRFWNMQCCVVYTRAVRGLLQFYIKKRKSRHRKSEESLEHQRRYSMWTLPGKDLEHKKRETRQRTVQRIWSNR